MKKVLSAILGGFLAASSAQPAEAGSLIDISGYYRVMYMNEVNPGHNRGMESFTDSYFQDRLNIDLTFRPTEEIAVYWRMRGPGSYQRWGRANRSRHGWGEMVYTEHLYGEIRRPWGTVLVGRLDEDYDAYGLASLGYRPENIPIYTKVGPFDGGGPRDAGKPLDGLRFTHYWDNGFSIMAQYAKLDNNDQSHGPIRKEQDGHGGWVYVDGQNPYSDQDHDRYQIEAAYAWDGGGLALNVAYDRNATGNAKDQHLRGNPYGWGYHGVLKKTETWFLNPAFMHSWGDFSLHFEGLAAWGKANYIMSDAPFEDRDGKGYGAYLDFDL